MSDFVFSFASNVIQCAKAPAKVPARRSVSTANISAKEEPVLTSHFVLLYSLVNFEFAFLFCSGVAIFILKLKWTMRGDSSV